MNYLSEYQGYVVDFREDKFKRVDDQGKVGFTIDFTSELGTAMLIGFSAQMLEVYYNGLQGSDIKIIRYVRGGEKNHATKKSIRPATAKTTNPAHEG